VAPSRQPANVPNHVWTADVDIHINEDPVAMAEHAEPRWREVLLELRHVDARYLDIPGFSVGWNAIDPPIPGRTVLGEGAGTHPDWEVRSVGNAAQMRAELDELTVDVGIIFPDHLLTLAAIPNPQYACAIARSYNRWLIAEWLEGQPGLFGAIVAPPHDPSEAAHEIRTHADHPAVVAIFLPTAAVNPLWGHRSYDPIFEAAQEVGLPVVLHTVGMIHPNFPHQTQGIETTGARHALQHSLGMICNMLSMIGTGVPARFPDMKIVFTEGGVGWVPWMCWRLDKEFMSRRRELPFYEEQPSHYVKKFFFATQPIEEPDEPRILADLIEREGLASQLMFASDWPHHDFDHPSQIARFRFTAENHAKIMGGTARAVFGLEA
jgi:predicted TIM-barrel fold metal-dependent hydrolase